MHITALYNLLTLKLQFMILNRYYCIYVYVQCNIHRCTLDPKYMFHHFKIQSCCTKLQGSKGRGTSVIVSTVPSLYRHPWFIKWKRNPFLTSVSQPPSPLTEKLRLGVVAKTFCTNDATDVALYQMAGCKESAWFHSYVPAYSWRNADE